MPLDRIRSMDIFFWLNGLVAFLRGYDITEVPIHLQTDAGEVKNVAEDQLEAAVRIWDVWWHYRDLHNNHPHKIK